MNKPHETHPTRENLEARIKELEKDRPTPTREAIDRHKAAQQILGSLAPEYPMSQDEQGGCVWCGGTPPGSTYGYAGRYRSDHSVDCPWLEAREFLGDHIEGKRAPLQRSFRGKN